MSTRTATQTGVKAKNQVLSDDYRPSSNFYQSDLILRHYLGKNLSSEGFGYMKDKLEWTGEQAAVVMDELSLRADKQGPQLVKRDKWGNDIDDISFDPSYWKLMEIAVKSEMFTVKWKPDLRAKFENEKHQLGFSTGYLYGMSECGQYCPLCMTDGVARLIDFFGEEEDKARLLPHIWTDNWEELYTGAMYLTEKSGGSDVGANLVKADHVQGREFKLNGEKWFCSNANADIIFALARTDENVPGTRGLSIFLVEKKLPNGEKNPVDVIRLKDKLGVRSMASAECILTDTRGLLVGEEFKGFKIMAEMLNLSRLYNSVAAISAARRALTEAYQFLKFRKSFGKEMLDHALIRAKLTELGSLNVAGFYLTWRAIKALDEADTGNERSASLFRLLTPMMKKWTAEQGVYMVRESMELMGGVGYIEDGVVAKIMRDVMVLPIWEGSGNIMVLDMLRALAKSEGFQVMCEDIESSALKNDTYKDWLLTELNQLKEVAQSLFTLPQDEMEMTGKHVFERLTTLYQMALMIEARDETSKAWIDPALAYFQQMDNTAVRQDKPFSREVVEGLVAWEV